MGLLTLLFDKPPYSDLKRMELLEKKSNAEGLTEEEIRECTTIRKIYARYRIKIGLFWLVVTVFLFSSAASIGDSWRDDWKGPAVPMLVLAIASLFVSFGHLAGGWYDKGELKTVVKRDVEKLLEKAKGLEKDQVVALNEARICYNDRDFQKALCHTERAQKKAKELLDLAKGNLVELAKKYNVDNFNMDIAPTTRYDETGVVVRRCQRWIKVLSMPRDAKSYEKAFNFEQEKDNQVYEKLYQQALKNREKVELQILPKEGAIMEKKKNDIGKVRLEYNNATEAERQRGSFLGASLEDKLRNAEASLSAAERELIDTKSILSIPLAGVYPNMYLKES